MSPENNLAFNLPLADGFDAERLPPEDVRILELSADPYPDGQRIRINLKITPYQKRPHIELAVLDPAGSEVSTISIIEPINWNLELTAHLRAAPQDGIYTLAARLFYPPRDEEDPKLARVDIPVDDTDTRNASFTLFEA
jgi:hypothetical protein